MTCNQLLDYQRGFELRCCRDSGHYGIHRTRGWEPDPVGPFRLPRRGLDAEEIMERLERFMEGRR